MVGARWWVLDGGCSNTNLCAKTIDLKPRMGIGKESRYVASCPIK